MGRTKSRNQQGGVPAVRGDSRGVVNDATRHRCTAIIGQALDILEGRRGTERDPAKRLADEFDKDPRGFISWVNETLGPAPSAPTGGMAAMAGLAGMFAGAAAIAAGNAAGSGSAPSAEVVEGEFTPVDSGVQSGDSVAQPIDNEW